MKGKNFNNKLLYENEKRDSSIELYRIIVMIFIIMHHYVVNSGLIIPNGPIYSDPLSWRSIFLLLFGAWGKIGINCFVLITGYFMCKSHITIKKFLNLLLEVEFYKIFFWVLFLFWGYESFSIERIVKVLLPISNIEDNFTGCFLVFYLFIPFLNILIQNMDENNHRRLILLLSITYILFGTLPIFSVRMNYVSWFVTLYFIASYIRCYPKLIFEKRKFWALMTIFFCFLAMISVVGCAWLGAQWGTQISYKFVSDSNTFLAVAVGISTFLFFKNLGLEYNKVINTIAASTFGVLQIHANSDAMRKWLWKDVLNNVGMYDSSWLVVHAISSVIGIFGVCVVIDLLRRFVFEKVVLHFRG